MAFPTTRLRRLRKNARIRDMLTETRIHPSGLVYPMFVDERLNEKRELDLMPGQFTYAVGEVGEVASRLEEKGINAVLLFGVPRKKDAGGTQAFSRQGIVQKAIREIRSNSSILIASDLCLCEYTSNGQCGILKSGNVENDTTLEIYSKIALSHAEAGSDIIAPSGMMDGQVAAIRSTLDGSGYGDRAIMAYASKSASSFYGPFREAAESAPSEGDRKGYQINYANFRESMHELKLDFDEGADILMVKPALLNLDIIHGARSRFDVPIAAFNVSGEYSMVRAASKAGMLDYKQAVLEIATSIFRAGADLLITYHAQELAEWVLQ